MKTRILFFVILLTSCAPSSYFQVYNTQAESRDIQLSQDSVIYADSVCMISYNLWSDGGTSGFWMYNGTESDMILHLDRSFLVINDVAYPYYSQRIRPAIVREESVYYPGITPFERFETWSRTVAVDAGGSSYFVPERTMRIPHGTWRYVEGLAIHSSIFKDCDLDPYPGFGKKKSAISFTESTSPLRFNNRVVYSLEGDSTGMIEINNRFYVNEIINYPFLEVRKTVQVQECGRTVTNRINTAEAYNRFYLRYILND